MTSEILFYEKQRFNQWWLWLIFLGINGMLLFGVIYQLTTGKPFGDKPMSDNGLFVAAAVFMIITLLFAFTKLETIIKVNGIYIRFFPFHLKWKSYTKESISKIYIRQYSPIMDYGGWGFRIGLMGQGNAYNVSGNMGIQIEFKNNKKLLIGTQKQEQVDRILAETHFNASGHSN